MSNGPRNLARRAALERLMSIKIALLSALATLCLAAPATAAAPWSTPEDLGSPSDYVAPSGLAALPSGAAVLAWTARTQPAGAGGLPAAVSVQADARDNDGEQGVIGAVGPDGAGRVVGRHGWSLLAGPVAGGGGRVLALVSRVVAGDDDGNRYLQVSLVRLDASGRVLSTRRLVQRAIIRSADLASNARGDAVATWVQAKPFVLRPHQRHLPEHAFQELQSLRAASIGPSGRPGAITDLERTWATGTDYGGQVAAAVGADGRALIGLVAGHGGRRGSRAVDAFVRRPRGRFGAPRRVGPQSGNGAIAAAFAPTGSAVLAWGTQDGGEEANQPWVVRAATISTALARWNAPQVLDPGGLAERPGGGVAAAGLADGTLAVAWSGVAGSALKTTFPLHVATASAGGRFAGSSTLAPDASVGSLAAAPDGRLLVTWATVPDYSAPGPTPPTQAMAALRAAGASSFGAPEALADPDVASPPLAAFLPDGRAVAVWAARPDGQDPSEGVGATGVVRVALRSPG
jgi:hypothetical protein